MSENFDKFAILESFLDEVTSYLPEIEANLDTLQQHPDDTNVIEETYRRAHTIGGSAAMMGFDNLAHVAQGMEDTLGNAIDAQAGLSAPAIALLRRSFSRLSRLVEHIRSNTDGSSLVAEDDADRAAAPGNSSPAISNHGLGGAGATGLGNGSIPAETGRSTAPGMAVPDWLAPFAAPGVAPTTPSNSPNGSNGFNGSNDQSPQPQPFGASQPSAGYPYDASAMPTAPMNGGSSGQFAQSQPVWTGNSSNPGAFQPGASQSAMPQTPQSDPWASSISNYPTGRAPAMPPQQNFGASQPGTYLPQQMSPSASGAFGGAPQTPQESLDDILNAFTARPAESDGAEALMETAPRIPVVPPAASSSWQQSQPQGVDFSQMGTDQMPAVGGFNQFNQSRPPAAGSYAQQGSGADANVVASLDELRLGEETVRRQVATLRDVAASIYNAAKAMEDERTELRGFLDGSRDALDRLEEWAGRHMGLDLQRSPDSVRRYLPLSVIWVTTMRLKKLIALLNNSGRGLTATQEQIEETLDDLRLMMANFGQIFQSISSVGGAPEHGFSATVAQFAWNPAPPAAPERTVSSASSETPALTPGMRAELERDVREQLRRLLEDEVRAEIAAEVRRDEEDRLRQELQIQVRRQLLTELTPGMASDALGQGVGGVLSALPPMSVGSGRGSKPVQITSEQSPEAMEVFREEAQEHLQTITAGIAQLESAPHDTGALQNIRRAMHTLKGAAGMMGFSIIQQTAHASEDLLDRLVEGTLTLTPDVLSLLLDTSEALDFMATRVLNQPAEQQRSLQSLASRYTELTGIEIPEEFLGEPSATPRTTDPVMIGLEEESEEGAEQHSAPDGTDLSVRLQLSKLDELVNLFGELLINRSVLEERVDRLNRLVNDSNVVGERLREVGSQIETGIEAATLPSGPGSVGSLMGNGQGQSGRGGWLPFAKGQSSQGFHELELDRYNEFHLLTRNLNESITDTLTLTHEMESVLRECQASFARESRLSSDFQERLLKARLVPLQSLVPRLYRAARGSALREGKEIEFFADGTDTEVDRKVFEEVAGPLLHLVRNAVNHGIERPEVREAAGKPRVGKILVSAAYEGNQVVIAVRDDGAGIDPQHIRETAIARGWIDSYSQLSEKEAINLIFQPGITTAESLTEEAGRGVGLDVVRDTVTRLRGTIGVESVIGQGTIFTMKFPISLQIARAVLVKVKNQTLAIPMAVVDQIGRLDYYQTVSTPVPAIELRGERYTLAHLASYLRLPPSPVEERSSVLLVNTGNRRVALLVDAVVVQQEIVAKPLGPHLRDVRGVAGAAVLGNGQVVVILELHELLAQPAQDAVVLPDKSASSVSRLESQDTSVTPAPRPVMPTYPTATQGVNGAGGNMAIPVGPANGAASPPPPAYPQTPAASMPPMSVESGQLTTSPTGPVPFVISNQSAGVSSAHRVAVPPAAHRSYILVVDDSPSVRRVVSNMLKAHNWEVQTARDGVEALEVIARQMPAAVLLDIEMPRMDGYELMATIRSQEQYQHLPLIVLTSRAATKHHQRAFQLGADAYLVKPYQDEELTSTLARLIQEQ